MQESAGLNNASSKTPNKVNSWDYLISLSGKQAAKILSATRSLGSLKWALKHNYLKSKN
jgi:hypothetical protein